MNAAVKPGEPFVCWACQRECFGAVIQTGDVVICEPCNECAPSPLRIAYYDPARMLADRVRAQEPALPPKADAAQPEQPHPPADSSTATEPSQSATETHGDGGGAGASLPPGWTGPHANALTEYLAYGATGDGNPVVWHDRSWSWSSADGSKDGEAPSMLEAMCCALGITLEQRPFHLHTYARVGADVVHSLGTESCARVALDRYHAQQQAKAVRVEADELRAEAKRLMAPMRPTHGDHDRARCDVCAASGHRQAPQSSPELSTHERPPVSDAVREERCPPPPETLVGALQDRIHPTSGKLLGSKRLALPASASQTPATAEWYGEAVAIAYDALRAIDSYRLGAIDESALGLELLRASNTLGSAASRARYRAAGGRR